MIDATNFDEEQLTNLMRYPFICAYCGFILNLPKDTEIQEHFKTAHPEMAP